MHGNCALLTNPTHLHYQQQTTSPFRNPYRKSLVYRLYRVSMNHTPNLHAPLNDPHGSIAFRAYVPCTYVVTSGLQHLG
jgi:hypothetical protein